MSSQLVLDAAKFYKECREELLKEKVTHLVCEGDNSVLLSRLIIQENPMTQLTDVSVKVKMNGREFISVSHHDYHGMTEAEKDLASLNEVVTVVLDALRPQVKRAVLEQTYLRR